jgi:phosphopantetheinyl transferase
VLSRREREAWRGLGASAKRQREWLLGRAAAKDAVRRLVERRHGARLCPADVEILPDERGRPRVGGAWTERLGVAPTVSISHSNGVAVALAAIEGHRSVGIDIESLSHSPPGFETAAFTSREREFLASLPKEMRPEWSLRLWCSKEAAGKALGRGLAAGLTALQLKTVDLDAGALRLELADPLRAGLPGFSGREIVSCTVREGDCVASAVVQGLPAPADGTPAPDTWHGELQPAAEGAPRLRAGGH